MRRLISLIAVSCLLVGSIAATTAAADPKNTTILGLTGDLLVNRDDPEAVFDKMIPALDATDILFGNIETAYTDDPVAAVTALIPSFAPMSNLIAFADAGYEVLSMANNHSIDAGRASMLRLRNRLEQEGIRTVGTGANLMEAREPVFVERNGLKVAYLAYASTFPSGYEAREQFAGLNPMRSHNVYIETLENYYAPGIPPIVGALPNRRDLSNMKDDIARARASADIVVTSFHWGDMQKAFHLTDHEKVIARAAIDAGADIVAGHHHHILRGIEWYEGKPIFYGLGHFVFDINVKMPDDVVRMLSGPIDDPDFHGFQWHEDWPFLPMNPQARMTALAWAIVSVDGVEGVGFLPARIDKKGHVHPADPDSPEGKEVVDYVREGITSQGLNGRISKKGAIDLGGHATVRVWPAE